MANYNVTITNEGQTFLLNAVLGSNLLITQAKFSENDYVGQEATMTAADFGGVFISAPASAILVDSTTIKIMSGFDNDSFTEEHVLRSIGIFGEDIYDPYTPILVAVCTTTTPDIIPTKIFDSASTYAYNINLSVSDTENITIVDPQAAALYTTDVIDVLTSPATNAPLSANQGRVLAENLAANEESGATNKLPYPYFQTTKTENDITFTDVGDGTITVSGVASGGVTFYLTNNYTGTPLKQGVYKVNGCPINGGATSYRTTIEVYNALGQTVSTHYDDGEGVEISVADNQSLHLSINVSSGVDLSTPITFKPMIYDARIINPTFAPYAKTNKELTDNVSGLANENLVINGWFTINQRGATLVNTDGAYFADMFKLIGILGNPIATSVTHNSDDSITWTTSATVNTIGTRIPLNDSLRGKQVTLSVNVNDEIIARTFIIPTTRDAQGTTIFASNVIDNPQISVFVSEGDGSTYELAIDFNCYAAGSATFRTVMLEPGSKSTLAQSVKPDPTTELLKCQRYFYRMTQSVVTAQMALVMGFDGTNTYGIIKTPVPMVSTPTLSFAGTFNLSDVTNTYPVTNMSLTAYGGDTGTLFAQAIGGGITVSKMYVLMCGSSNAYIDLSADL